MSDEMEHTQECLLGARFLWRELRDLFGHVSCRRPDGKGFWLMMVRVSANPSTWDEVMSFDYDGQKLSGEQPTPYEIYLHTEIFRTRPEVQSVVHCHPHVATALTMAGKSIHAICHQSSRYGTGIPVFKGDFIEDVGIGRELAQCLGKAPAALLKGHGAVTVGNSVPDAVTNALFLEQAAQQQVYAATVGTPEVLEEYLRAHKFPQERSKGGAGTYLWRQLLWEMTQEESHNHPHPHPHA